MVKNKQFIDLREYKINPITQYRLKIPLYKQIIGYFFLIIAVFPNGLGFICYPISFICLKNYNKRDIYYIISNKIDIIYHKIKLSLLFYNGKNR